jgi:hypothetical protein
MDDEHMTPRQDAMISVLDNLFLDMENCVNHAPAGHTFVDDLDILAEKFIKNFRINIHLYNIFKPTQKIKQINTLFNVNERIKPLIKKTLLYTNPRQGWRQFQTKKHFKSDEINPHYYTFASRDDKLLDVWLKGLELVREKAIKKLEVENENFGSEEKAESNARAALASSNALKGANTQGGASTKHTTRRPLRRKSGTKRLRRRRSNRHRRTSRK